MANLVDDLFGGEARLISDSNAPHRYARPADARGPRISDERTINVPTLMVVDRSSSSRRAPVLAASHATRALAEEPPWPFHFWTQVLIASQVSSGTVASWNRRRRCMPLR